MKEGLALVRNPDIRISEGMKTDEGKRVLRVVAGGEETDAEERENETTESGAGRKAPRKASYLEGRRRPRIQGLWRPEKRTRREKETLRSNHSATSLDGRGFSRSAYERQGNPIVPTELGLLVPSVATTGSRGKGKDKKDGIR
ncbi:hypothetical protein NDU88_007580 [Pleurodeles waltl]|uniref:Uncharacterized protein n=1 Tax=Pleurodeles waltl TaxID=8319 RepID=A0AAV7QL57_PLEWA|nr:hypothetical protein NDU88_007580 [Pleurodeles waltl]